MKKKINLSKKDKEDWKKFIEDKSQVPDKESINQHYTNKKNLKFDLHGFTLDEANKKVKEIILSCVEKKYKEILFITGKGKHSTNDKDIYTSKDLGRLKYSVPEFINSDQELSSLIVSIHDAKIKDGGEGAIIIKLKNL